MWLEIIRRLAKNSKIRIGKTNKGKDSGLTEYAKNREIQLTPEWTESIYLELVKPNSL